MAPSLIPDYIYKLKSSPGEFVLRYFGSNDYNWLSRLRCFPYRGKNDDPHFVAQNHTKLSKKKKPKKSEEQFILGLVEAEAAYQAKLDSRPKAKGKERKWKRIERNKVSKSGKKKLAAESLNASGDDEKCSCKRDDKDPCGIKSNCENRSLLIECGVSFLKKY